MTEPGHDSLRSAPTPRSGGSPTGTNLADILERVLDKGVVIAGDIQVNLLDIELLTIKLRLLVASVDKAKEMGIDWWEHDQSLSSGARRGTAEVNGSRTEELEAENEELRRRIQAWETEQPEITASPTERPQGRSEQGHTSEHGGNT